VDDGQGREVWRLPDGELAGALLSAEVDLRRAYARVVELTGEADRRGLGASLGFGNTLGLLAESLRLSRREASVRLRQAEQLTPERSLVGDPRPPALPATAAALRDGSIGVEHASVLVEVLRQARALDPTGETDAVARAEEILVPLAVQAVPQAVRSVGRELLARLDTDGQAPDETELREPRRELRTSRTRHGWYQFSGRLDPATGQLLDDLLGPLAKPHPKNPDTGEVDQRTVAERHGDALADILELAARCDELTVQGGERATLIVTMTLEQLTEKAGHALIGTPGLGTDGLDAGSLRRLCCQAAYVPAVLGGNSEVLDLGRAKRLATPAQRRALVLRDGGCAFPGCVRKPKWCQPHHILPAHHGGPTDLGNLVLLCTRHHRLIHHSEWQVHIRKHGLPEFTPPSWIDPRRQPLRNHAHLHPPPAGTSTASAA
jgi:hypothetical protein